MVNVTYGVCVGSWLKLTAHVIPYLNGNPLLALSGQPSIAVAYNSILDAAEHIDTDVLILQHDDLEIVDPEGETKIIAALEDQNIGVLGVAGGQYQGGIAWWNHNPIGHQRTDVTNIDFGAHAGETDLLEGSLLAFSRQGLDNIRFDTNYRGFHGYDVDISMQIRDVGLKVAVIDIDTWHHTPMGFKSAESHRDWLEADKRFQSKWGSP